MMFSQQQHAMLARPVENGHKQTEWKNRVRNEVVIFFWLERSWVLLLFRYGLGVRLRLTDAWTVAAAGTIRGQNVKCSDRRQAARSGHSAGRVMQEFDEQNRYGHDEENDCMTFPTVDSARLIRDGGIDAMAALDAVIFDAIAGLSPQEQQIIKHAFGEAMGGIIVNLINPAVGAFPELETDQSAWSAIAESRASIRANRSDRALLRTPSSNV